MTIPFYADPSAESSLRMGPSGGALVLVSQSASVSVRLGIGVDDQTTAGANFGRLRFLGIKPAQITASWIVLPEDENAFWAQVVPLARPKGRRGNAPPMNVINPQINRAGVDLVTVLDLEYGPPSARDGREVTMHMREWTPAPTDPKPAASPVDVAPAALQPAAIQANQ